MTESPQGAERDPLVGRRLGDFVVGEKLGEGGFGTVYRAWQPALSRDAVIKVLSARHHDDAAHARFMHEARLASQLDHPYAAHIYAFGAEPDGVLWIAMELVRGSTLAELIATRGALPLEHFVALFDRMCEVVHAAHERGIVHRDLKPHNVMVVTQAGRTFPKLLDFGIAKLRGETDTKRESGEPRARDVSRTRTDSLLGTPHYMAPEQWLEARDVGPAADLYALGVVAFEALTGSVPFGGTTVEAIADAHASQAPPSLGSAFSPALSDAIARSLAKQPQERFANALELAAAVRAAAGVDGAPLALELIEPALRDALLASAPQPIAECVAALDASRNLHQASATLAQLARAVIRYVALVTLAARTQTAADDGDAAELVRELYRDGLRDEQWIELVMRMLRSFAARPEAHPLPELVDAIFEREGELAVGGRALQAVAAALTSLERASGGDEALRPLLPRVGADLTDALGALAGVLAYSLVVPVDARYEAWTGLRRSPRALALRRTRTAVVDGRPLLVDAVGRPVVSLWPLMQAAAPSATADAELFLFDGPSSRGARFVSPPRGFEHYDDSVWDWLREHVTALDETARVDAKSERAPYRGLAAFTADDAGVYFGREREVEAFVNRLRVEPLLAVVGPSGAGKSSFVQAGVVPALPDRWRAITVRPGVAPLRALWAKLGSVLGIAAPADPMQLGDVLRNRDETIVLVVDQLEELFTLCADPQERETYARAVLAAARSAEDRVRVVVTLRDDFLVRAEEGAFRDRLGTAVKVLTTPADADLRRILVEPARKLDYQFEPAALADRIVKDVAGQPGALALLSYTAAALWEQRDKHFHRLTARAYDALGGVGGALARHAEELLAQLMPDEQRIVRELFRQLVTAEGTRQVMTRAELEQVLGGDHANRVIERLVAARLLVTAEDETGDERVEVIHEALLTAWPRLVGWREEDREGARFRQQLLATARQWHERERPKGLLWRGDALAEYRIWRTRHPQPLTEREEAFAAASIADATRTRRVRRIVVGVAFAVLLVGAGALLRLQQKAESRLVDNYVERGRRAVVDGDTLSGLVYLDEAHRMGADDPGLRFMLARAQDPHRAEIATLRGHMRQLWGTAFQPNGSRVATWSSDGTLRLWNATTGAQELVINAHAPGQMTAAFSPDGTEIASAGSDHVVRRWRTSDGSLVAALEGHTGPLTRVKYAPDGTWLASGGLDQTARIWELQGGRLVATLAAGGPVQDIQIDPTSTHVVATSMTGSSHVWKRDGSPVTDLRGHTQPVWFAAFDPEGKRVATSSLDGTAIVFEVATGKELARLVGHEQRVTHIAFHPDGKRIATASADRTARIWDASSGRLLLTLRGHAAQVNRIRFTSDGARLVSVAGDGMARVWDVARGTSVAFAHGGFVFDVAISADDKRMATASWLGTGKLWNLDALPLHSIEHHDTVAKADFAALLVSPLVLSRNGRWLARFYGNEVVVWNPIARTQHAFTSGQPIVAVAIDPADTMIAIAGDDGHARVYDLSTHALVRDVSASAGVVSVAFDPRRDALVTLDRARTLASWQLRTGNRIATRVLADAASRIEASPGGDVFVLWNPPPASTAKAVVVDAATFAPVGELGHDAAIELVRLSADGKLIFTSAGPILRTWAATGRRLSEVRHPGDLNAIVWDARASHVVLAGIDGSMTVATTDGRVVAQMKGHDNFIASLAVSDDGAFAAVGVGDGTLGIWDLARKRLISRFATGGEVAFEIAFSADGKHLLAAGLSYTDVWDLAPFDMTASRLAAWVRCHVPFRLDGETLVDAAMDDACR